MHRHLIRPDFYPLIVSNSDFCGCDPHVEGGVPGGGTAVGGGGPDDG